jgi:tetratricopeptide (TPR) repeat protein
MATAKGSLAPLMIQVTKKRIIIIVAAVLVLFGGLVAFWIWQAQGGRFFVAPSDNSPAKQKDVPQYGDDKRQELVDQVNQKQGSGDYQGAIRLLEGQQNSQDVRTQILLAGAYANAGEFQKSLEIYKKLVDTGTLPGIEYANMAAVAERAKDYRLALDCYKKAKENAVTTKQENDDQIAFYDYKIAEMEKQL